MQNLDGMNKKKLREVIEIQMTAYSVLLEENAILLESRNQHKLRYYTLAYGNPMPMSRLSPSILNKSG